MKITYNGELLDISTPNLEALILQQAGTESGGRRRTRWCCGAAFTVGEYRSARGC